MKHNPKVSVCIPTYNRSEYLREAIESVLSQSFKDFELVICDNASTDETEQVVHSFHDDRISYYRNTENVGSRKNINLCCKLAKGTYVTIFHDDDLMLPDNLAKKVEFLDAHSKIGLVYSNAYYINGLGQITGLYTKKNVDDNILEENESRFRKLFKGNPICFPTVMMRRRCFEEHGSFEEIPCCDWEMWMRTSLFYDIGYIREPLIKYRRHDGNDSLNYVGIVVEYETKMSIVNKYALKIPEVRSLGKTVPMDICKRAAEGSFSFLNKGEGRSFNKFISSAALSLKINPFIAVFYMLKVILEKSVRAAKLFILGLILKLPGLHEKYDLLQEYRRETAWNKRVIKWMLSKKRDDIFIHPAIYFVGGTKPVLESLKIGSGGYIDKEFSLWISEDEGADPKLTIKQKVYIGRNVFIGAFQPIEIGENVMIGAYSYIISGSHAYERRDISIQEQGFVGAPINIEDHAWLGTHVVVLPGVTIGKGAIVAAHSLVNKNIPPYEVWGGVPAKFLKHRPNIK